MAKIKVSKYKGVRVGRLVCTSCQGKEYLFRCDCGNESVYMTGSVFHYRTDYKTCGNCSDFKEWVDAGRPIQYEDSPRYEVDQVSCYDCLYDPSYDEQKRGIVCKCENQKDVNGACISRVERPIESALYTIKKNGWKKCL